MVVDNHPTVPVEDFPARRDDRNCLDAIGLSALAVEIGIADLDIQKPEMRKRKYRRVRYWKKAVFSLANLGSSRTIGLSGTRCARSVLRG